MMFLFQPILFFGLPFPKEPFLTISLPPQFGHFISRFFTLVFILSFTIITHILGLPIFLIRWERSNVIEPFK